MEQPQEENPSLRGAKLRTMRADEHIDELESVLADLREEAAVRITLPKEAVTGPSESYAPAIDWSGSSRPPTWWVAILAGETTYNLRAALDYLVFALARLDSGAGRPENQFPIADTERKWVQQRRSRLKGIALERQDAFRRHQPFLGCEWTGLLRDLSNPDKHRMLTSVHVEFSGELRMDTEQVTRLPGDPERVSVPVPSQTVQFCFWNGAPVVDTLHGLCTEVKQVLAEFQRDFGESDKLIPRQ